MRASTVDSLRPMLIENRKWKPSSDPARLFEVKYNITALQLSERKRRLKRVFKSRPKYAPCGRGDPRSRARTCMRLRLGMELEGLVVKRADGPYEPGERGRHSGTRFAALEPSSQNASRGADVGVPRLRRALKAGAGEDSDSPRRTYSAAQP